MRQSFIDLMERGYVPDWLIRMGIRGLLNRQLPAKAETADQDDTVIHRPEDNVPVEFWQNVLGPRLYSSSCWWPKEARDLETAEAAMLAFIAERAELGFDQDILDFGCGWGALALWMAEFYPDSRIVAVSDSSLQRELIMARSRERSLSNIQVSAIDSIDFFGNHRFDRVMLGAGFESMRMYPELGKQIHAYLKPGGKLFLHGVTCRQPVQPYVTEADAWLARHFGNSMLMSEDWLPLFQDALTLEEQWHFEGFNYQRTLEAWLANQDHHREAIMALFRNTYGIDQAASRFRRWRFFFIAHAEAFGYRASRQWTVSHYRFAKP